jgi:outer membrane protein
MILRKSLLYVVFVLASTLSHADDLLSVYQAAVSGDPRLKLAGLKVGIGEAAEQQAVGKMLPQLQGRISFSENRQDLETSQLSSGSRDSFSGEKYNLLLTQTLFDMPKYYSWRAQKETGSQYLLELSDVKQELMVDVVTGYFTVLESMDALALVGHEIAANEQLLRQVEKLYEKELAKITELLEVRASYDKLQADQVQAESQVAIARGKLYELTGSPIGELKRLSDTVEFVVVEDSLEQWVEKVASKNVALAGLSKAIDAQHYGLLEKKTGRLPVVDLQLSHQKSDLGYENSSRPLTTTDYVGVNVSVPLFTGGVTSGQIKEARQRLEVARYNYEAEYRVLIKEVRDAFLQANAHVRRIEAAEKAALSSQKARQAMEKGFKLGAVTSVDVLDAQRKEFRALNDLSQAKYGYVMERVRLLKISGLMDKHALVQINQWLAAG